MNNKELLDIWAQLEQEKSWRQDEIRLLENQLSLIKKEPDKDIYRKSLIVMLYSHYEGFFKSAFSIYAKAINNENIKCREATDFLSAATLAQEFHALHNPEKKCDCFRSLLPEDTKLHRFAREVEFLCNLDNFWDKKIEIPDTVYDPESNLKVIILRKILFRMGFNYKIFERFEGNIHRLLKIRNDVAHGDRKNGLSNKEYREIAKAIFSTMSELIVILMDSLKNRSYKKP